MKIIVNMNDVIHHFFFPLYCLPETKAAPGLLKIGAYVLQIL